MSLEDLTYEDRMLFYDLLRKANLPMNKVKHRMNLRSKKARLENLRDAAKLVCLDSIEVCEKDWNRAIYRRLQEIEECLGEEE